MIFIGCLGAESSDVKLKQRLGDRLTRSNLGSSSETVEFPARSKRFTVGLCDWLQELQFKSNKAPLFQECVANLCESLQYIAGLVFQG